MVREAAAESFVDHGRTHILKLESESTNILSCEICIKHKYDYIPCLDACNCCNIADLNTSGSPRSSLHPSSIVLECHVTSNATSQLVIRNGPERDTQFDVHMRAL